MNSSILVRVLLTSVIEFIKGEQLLNNISITSEKKISFVKFVFFIVSSC